MGPAHSESPPLLSAQCGSFFVSLPIGLCSAAFQAVLKDGCSVLAAVVGGGEYYVYLHHHLGRKPLKVDFNWGHLW